MVLGRLLACRSVEGSHRSGNPADEQHNDSLAAECAKDGRDYLSVLRQRAKEIKLMKELGIPISSESPESPKSPGQQTEPDDGSEPREDI